jgi:hypothetical protein
MIYEYQSSPVRRALATAWVRLFAESFEKMLLTWRLTVLIASTSCSAISKLEAPLTHNKYMICILLCQSIKSQYVTSG